uniref:Superoxide dismutase copper chaperone n=1 Tax=Hirondellea gigas TaxID=1518452 RepID=A0A6A7G6A2_9CRUS
MSQERVKRSEFAVEMNCNDCVQLVRKTLDNTAGISAFQIDLEQQTVVIEGSLPPSQLYEALAKSGKRVQLRAQGGVNGANLGAAVALLHSRLTGVMGVVRFTQTSENICSIDATIDGMKPGDHGIHVHTYGDISGDGVNSGPHFNPSDSGHGKSDGSDRHFGDLGNITANEFGRGVLHCDDPKLKVWDIIGRSVCVDVLRDSYESKNDGSRDKHLACGVVARSAGIFQNTKRICQCDGRTLWSEDTSQVAWANEAANVERSQMSANQPKTTSPL